MLMRKLSSIPTVVNVHDLHVWTLTTGMDVATVHLECEGSSSMVLDRARSLLSTYGLDHATVQVEPTAHGRTCKEELTW